MESTSLYIAVLVMCFIALLSIRMASKVALARMDDQRRHDQAAERYEQAIRDARQQVIDITERLDDERDGFESEKTRLHANIVMLENKIAANVIEIMSLTSELAGFATVKERCVELYEIVQGFDPDAVQRETMTDDQTVEFNALYRYWFGRGKCLRRRFDNGVLAEFFPKPMTDDDFDEVGNSVKVALRDLFELDGAAHHAFDEGWQSV